MSPRRHTPENSVVVGPAHLRPGSHRVVPSRRKIASAQGGRYPVDQREEVGGDPLELLIQR